MPIFQYVVVAFILWIIWVSCVLVSEYGHERKFRCNNEDLFAYFGILMVLCCLWPLVIIYMLLKNLFMLYLWCIKKIAMFLIHRGYKF